MKNSIILLLVIVFISLQFTALSQQNHGYQSKASPALIKTLGEIATGPANTGRTDQQNENEENENMGRRATDPSSPAVASYQNASAANLPTGILSIGNLAVASNFLASTTSEGALNFYPPDCNADVSSFSQLMLTVNGKIKVYNVPSVIGTALTTTQISSASSLASPVLYMNSDSFFTNAGLGINKITDPHIRFDRFSKRWFIIAQDLSAAHTSANYLCVAVSNAAAALTTSSTFSVYYILSTTNDPTASSDWLDYPTLGVDKNALYVSANMVDKATHSVNKGSALYVLRKDSLLAGNPLFTVWPRGTGAGTSGSDGAVGMLTPQAAQNDDPNATTGFFIATGWTYGQLIIKRVTNPGTSTPTLSSDIVLTVPVTIVPIDQPAMGTVGSLNPFDDRLFEATVMKNKITGTVSLWTAHNIEVNTSGVATAGGGRNGARWYEITNLTTTPTLNQSGTIFDAAATNPRGFIIPSIAMNGQGHALIGGTTSSAVSRIQIMMASRYSSDALGTMQAFDTLTKVTHAYSPNGSNERWGDYSQTVVDPSDNMTMWTFQEYANNTNSWGLRAVQVKAPPPAQSVTVSGVPASFYGSAVAVTLNGSATNNAGFFDPGTGYNRLVVACSGGIVVTNVVFVSPTQVTCTINTIGIAAGIYTLTITNPDGQAVTANFTLTTSTVTDYFRTRQSGNWSDVNSWESSTASDFSSLLISPASLSPSTTANKISILNGHTVTVISNATTDKTFINPGGRLVVTGCTLTVNNGGLTVQSTSAGSGTIGNSTGTITGNVTVERYIPDDGHRAWRLLSVPTTGQTIRQAWQENGVNTANLGTLITTHNYTDGFDAPLSNNPSILMHSQGGLGGPSWTTRPVTSTNVAIANEQGYMLYVRGDRTATAVNGIHPFTVLRTTGSIKQGTQSAVNISSTGSGYTLVGNPFPSAIDFEAMAGTANLDQNFYIWDANLSGTYGVGGYRTVQRTGPGSYQQTPQVAGGAVSDNTMRYIHSGQAFFLHSSGAGASVVLSENTKANSTPSINPFNPQSLEQQLTVNVFVVNAGNITSLADGIRIRYDSSFLASTSDDVLKMFNFSENLVSFRENNSLIIEKRPLIQGTDTIFLRLTGTGVKTYQFEVNAINFTQPNIVANLQDNYLNTSTPIGLSGITDINFDVTADPASAAPDRFEIVFAPASVLPISLSSIKAFQQNTNIALEWKVENEAGIQKYNVEKSIDGITFYYVGTVNAMGNSYSLVSYSWLDVNAVAGNNYYRIRSIGIGREEYSTIVKVFIGKGLPGIIVYPNPATDGIIHLQMNNMPKGTYTIQLMNSIGQAIFNKAIDHADGSSTEIITPGKNLARGNYLLEVTNPDKSKLTSKFIY